MKVAFKTLFALTIFAASANAFSLLGPYEDWMQTTNGFRQPGDIGGPMNVGEEYRWNVPVLFYTFDQSFLDYFGTNGVTAVEQAIQILNELPSVSQINLGSYPAEAFGQNYLAGALGLMDLKSKTLQLLLEQMGLGEPSRYAFSMRSFKFVGGTIQSTIIQRNFDPNTVSPSTAVNDSEYNYNLFLDTNGTQIVAYPYVFLVDPLDTMRPAVADGFLNTGTFYTGLTRDDVGGLIYLLRTNNLNIETLLPGIRNLGTSNNLVNRALRPGINKITFVRRDYDSLLGQFFPPLTNQFTDVYFTNNALVEQQLERVVTEPDLLFSCADLANATSPLVVRTGTTNWWNGSLFGFAGPGVIRPPVRIFFNKSVPAIYTSDASTNTALWMNYRWGSFDGSTNLPVIYPNGASQSTNQMILNLWLHNEAGTNFGFFCWNLPVPLGGVVNLQTSTNLTDWTLLGPVVNSGTPVNWHHTISWERRFFRVATQ